MPSRQSGRARPLRRLMSSPTAPPTAEKASHSEGGCCSDDGSGGCGTGGSSSALTDFGNAGRRSTGAASLGEPLV